MKFAQCKDVAKICLLQFTHVCKLNMAANVAFTMSPTDLL